MQYNNISFDKKKKIQPCVLIKYRYRIQEPEKAYKQCVFIERKNLQTFLVCPC